MRRGALSAGCTPALCARQLTVGDDVRPGIFDEKMNMVRGDHIVEHGQTQAFFGLENPVQITASITRKLQ
jgi:hypothetical protein